jgi:hypothetical protein
MSDTKISLPPLYSRTSTGAIQRWTIHVVGDSYYTVYGQVDGAQQTSQPMICEGKNIGKANETSGASQAHKEAAALWKKKKESGCFVSVDDIDV